MPRAMNYIVKQDFIFDTDSAVNTSGKDSNTIVTPRSSVSAKILNRQLKHAMNILLNEMTKK